MRDDACLPHACQLLPAHAEGFIGDHTGIGVIWLTRPDLFIRACTATLQVDSKSCTFHDIYIEPSCLLKPCSKPFNAMQSNQYLAYVEHENYTF